MSNIDKFKDAYDLWASKEPRRELEQFIEGFGSIYVSKDFKEIVLYDGNNGHDMPKRIGMKIQHARKVYAFLKILFEEEQE